MIMKKILTYTCLIFCFQTISRGIYNQVASQETKELKRTINFSNHNLAANSSWTTQLSVDQTWDTETDMENVDFQNIRQGRRCWAFTYRYISYQTTIFWKIFLIDKPLWGPSLDISWESRCNIEINVWAHFYKILLVFEVSYPPWVKGMPVKG